MGSIQPELIYEDAPGDCERDFLQIHMEQTAVKVLPGRVVDNALSVALIENVNKHQDAKRLRRSIGHYTAALDNWRPGDELTALEHLVMAAEAFAPAALRAHQANHRLTDEQLAAEWKLYQIGE